MRILLLRTWLSNVGNGFIDMGAKEIIKSACDNCEIIEVSGYPNSYEVGSQLPVEGGIRYALNNRLGINFPDKYSNRSNINIAEFIDADLAILPGCILYRHEFEKYYPTLLKLREEDIPILILGGGASDYSRETQKYMKKRLSELEINSIITRNPQAYDCYSDAVEYCYNGIDCAYFVDEWFEPVETKKKFSTVTIEKSDEPNLDLKNIVRPNHRPFDSILKSFVKRYIQYEKSISKDIASMLEEPRMSIRENELSSDILTDYLFLYANTTETHTDRIHAFIPTVIHGNYARFYHETPRAGVFRDLLDGDPTSKLVTIDQNKLATRKQKQIDALKKAINISINEDTI